MASASMARRTSGGGHRSPRMCSLRASPEPTPKRNRPPGSRFADVAAAWARIAGWMRTVGHVTAVVTVRSVVAAMPPMTDQTNGECPCRSIHGW